MAYRFNKDEAIPRAVQRVFAEELSFAVGKLTGSKKRAEAVHEARKSIKKIRALLSLLGPTARTLDRYFRDAGRLLSDVRDRVVMLEVFNKLAEKHPGLAAATVAEIRGNLRQREPHQAAEKSASAQVAELLQKAPPLPVQNLQVETLLGAADATYRAGRKAFKRARKEESSENTHEFRKEVKKHWYHLRLLGGDAAVQRLEDLHQLETLLGDEHNLSVLRHRLKSEVETSRDRQQIRHILEQIDQDSETLRKRALEAGERLYSEKALPIPKPPALARAPQHLRARSAVA